MSNFKILGRHPTLWIALINVVIMTLATLQFRFLDNEQAGLIVAAINAVFGALTAWLVRPIQPAIFTYAVGAIIALLSAYGLEVTPEQLAGLNSVTIAVLAFLTYGQVSPQETFLTNATASSKAPEASVPGAH